MLSFFDTYTDAVAALGSLSDDDVAGVVADETMGGASTFYVVESAALIFQTRSMAHGAEVLVAVIGSHAAPGADYLCDGTDDEVEIMLAMAAVAATGGGTVHIAAGIYSVSTNILSTYDGVYLAGERGQTIIQAAADYTSTLSPYDPTLSVNGIIAFVAVTGFGCDGFEIDGVTNDITTNGIIAIPQLLNGFGAVCQNFAITNNMVRLQDAHTYSIWSMRGEDGLIANNTVDGGHDLLDAATNQEGIEVYGGRRMLLTGNLISNVGNIGINMGGLPGTTEDCGLESVRAISNTIESCNIGIHLGTAWDAVNTGYHRGVIVADNSISKIATTGISYDLFAFSEEDIAGAAVTPVILEKVDIHDNTIHMATAEEGGVAAGVPIQINNQLLVAGINAHAIELHHNVTTGAPHTDSAGHVYIIQFRGFKFTQNEIVVDNPASSTQGAFLTGCKDFDFSENKIIGAGQAGMSISGAVHFSINGNTIINWEQSGDNSYAGINIAGSSDGECRGNRFYLNRSWLLPLIGFASDCSGDIYYSNNTAIDSFQSGPVVSAAGPANFNKLIPSFSASKNATDQTGIASATFTKVTFTTAITNVGGYYDAANSKWTPPVGSYVINASFLLSGGLVDQARIALLVYKNGSVYRASWHGLSGTTNQSIAVNAPIEASGSDYFEIFAFIDGAGSKTINGSEVYSWFSGYARAAPQ